MKTVNQTRIVSQAAVNGSQEVEQTALFNASGTPFSLADLPLSTITTGTAIGTAAKTTTSPEPVANTLVAIKFTNGNTAATPTVAFNGGTARSILLGGTAPAAIEATLAANGVAMFFFDGTILHQIGVYS